MKRFFASSFAALALMAGAVFASTDGIDRVPIDVEFQIEHAEFAPVDLSELDVLAIEAVAAFVNQPERGTMATSRERQSQPAKAIMAFQPVATMLDYPKRI